MLATLRSFLPLALLTLCLTACPPPAAKKADGAAGGSDGAALFQQSCSACHGPKGEGMPNLGKDMTASEFIKSLSDADLIAFIKKGRAADDPANTTKVPMPPYGGNTSLTDADLQAIVSHIRSLSK